MSGRRVGAFSVVAMACCAFSTPGWATPPVRLDVQPFLAPPRPGPVELRIEMKTGTQPWRGVIDVAGRAARLGVDLRLPAHSRRLVILPFRIAGEDRVLEASITGQTVARVEMPPPPATSARLFVVDDGPGGAPATDDGAHLAVPLDRLPETASALERLDLLILPPDGVARLRPGQERAIERWVRWGGAVGVPGGLPTAVVRRFGAGAAISGGDVADIQRTFERWRGDLPPDAARAVFAAWEASTPTGTTTGRWAPSMDPRLVILVYLALLTAAGGLCAWFPGLRRAGLPMVALLIVGASLATWTAARAAGTVRVQVAETTLVLAPPDGGPCRVSTVVELTARGRTAWQVVPRVDDPAVYEVPTAALPGVARQAVRLSTDSGRWQRDLALGETAVLRIAGVGPAIGIAVTSHGPASWTVENRGPHHLRSAIIVGDDGAARSLGDVAPGGRVRGDLETPASSSRASDLEFWGRLLPRVASREPRAPPLLLARLDPPLSSLESMAWGVRAESTSHVALSLPVSPVQR